MVKRNIFLSCLALSALIFSTTTSHAQTIAQVKATGQWLDFNCQTLASLTDYEANPANLNFSKYGGWKAQQVDATGFFRVEKIDGRWWAIDPEGYLYIHKALNTVNLNNHTPDEIYQFLNQYGFNGMGSWSDEDILQSSLKESTPIAYCPKYSFIAMYRRSRNPRIEMPVFDDEFETFAQSAADNHPELVLSIANEEQGTSLEINESLLKVYPNPARDILNVSLSNNYIGEITIYSLTGKIMYNEPKLVGNTMINIDHLESGIYILKARGEFGTRTVKFVKTF